MNTLQKSSQAMKFLAATLGTTLFGPKSPKPPEHINNPSELEAYVDELVAMGQRGIAAVRNKYNWESEFKVLLQCYKDLLEK